MPDATFASPDLTTFCRLGEPGPEVFGQRPEPDRAFLFCRVTGATGCVQVSEQLDARRVVRIV